MRAHVALAFALSWLLARQARAFPTGEQFELDPVKEDGAGGIAFDGAPRWSGHTCVVCHTDPAGRVGIRIEADHPELFTAGWTPNQQYHLRVVLVNQHAAAEYQASGDRCGGAVTPYQRCDENGFALELADAGGRPVGKLVPVVANTCANSGTIPPDVDTRVFADGTAATHTGAHDGMTGWDLCWTAPAAGTGTITAYVAVVDGNGGNGTIEFPSDTTGDDTAAGAVPLLEVGGEPVGAQTGGCDATGGGGSVALALIGLAWLWSRRRRRPAIAIVIALAAGSACTHVRPRQRETLAKRSMTFAPDPVEDELDLHMQESREGSSGGYGSSGGGCGCN